MNILFLLIPLSLLLLGVAVAAFFWAMKNDQFDDLEGPAYSIFREDPLADRNKSGERPPHTSTPPPHNTDRR